MNTIIDFFESINPIIGALYATLFTWFLTALGSSLVFFIKSMNRALLDGLLGFTGGVMVAASFWSLLAPGIEMSPGEGFFKVVPAAIGFGFHRSQIMRKIDLLISIPLFHHYEYLSSPPFLL